MSEEEEAVVAAEDEKVSVEEGAVDADKAEVDAKAAEDGGAENAAQTGDGGGEGDAEGLGEERLGGEALHVNQKKFSFESCGFPSSSSFVASSLVSPVVPRSPSARVSCF